MSKNKQYYQTTIANLLDSIREVRTQLIILKKGYGVGENSQDYPIESQPQNTE